MKEFIACIFDTETTDLEDPRIIEAAYLMITKYYYTDGIALASYGRYNPGKDISFDAMAVHHILQEEVDSCHPCSSFELPDTKYLIGHNIDFDWKAYQLSGCRMQSPAQKLICTAAMGRFLFPGKNGKISSQSSLLYRLLGSKARELLKGAHSAATDVSNNRILLAKILDKAVTRKIISPPEELSEDDFWEQVYQFSEKARMPELMPFGKYAGTEIKDLPDDYKAWVMRQRNIDPYLLKAIMQH